MRNILVTGGAGFIGYNIARLLAEDPSNRVDIVDDLSKGEMDADLRQLLERKNVAFHNLDLTDSNAFGRLDDEYDHIYHLAAIVGVRKVNENPDLTIRVNALSTIYLLEYVKGMKNTPRVLFASSCENYAGSVSHFNAPVPTPEDVPLCVEDVHNPRWSYAASKILGEIACLQYAKKYGFEAVVVRYHNVYGPRMGMSHVIPEFILRLKDDPGIFTMFGGYQSRSFCYVTDAARMTVNLMNSPDACDRVVNVGNDRDVVRIEDLGKSLAGIMKVAPVMQELGAPAGSCDSRVPDLSLIRSMGAFACDVPFREGLLKTYEWYRDNYPPRR
jgi:UDP-glucose 4-epimerase/UDP-glucuronate decarboxylase